MYRREERYVRKRVERLKMGRLYQGGYEGGRDAHEGCRGWRKNIHSEESDYSS